MHHAALFALLLVSGPSYASAPPLRVTDRPPTGPRSRHYASNRSPLLASPLVRLPVTAVRPEGWLRRQLELMAEGMTGRLGEISPWLRFEESAFASASGEGKWGWEEMPYWLKGYTDLGYVLGDRRITADAKRWIDAILASQRPDGYFGPEANRTAPDIWPNMLVLCALRSHFEATGDRRVIPFMRRYCGWLSRLPLERYLPGDWQKTRGGDMLDTLYWLYNRTGDHALLDLARVNHERTSDWTGGIASFHGVNFAECFREPAQYFVQTRDARYLAAAERSYADMRGAYGQVPGGLYGADENARPGYSGPRQGAETCAIVEMMGSHEMLLGITGDGRWADRCEDVAFNSLPAASTPDLKAIHYLVAPNQIRLDRANKAPMIQNGGDMMSYSPFEQYRCCQHNVAFGWPYYAESLWMATPGDGLAAVLYAPCSVNARVGDGAEVGIREETGYPFEEGATFTLTTRRAVRFGLTLRVPGWCVRPAASVNGQPLAITGQRSGWVTIDREWANGDVVRLDLPMHVSATVWQKNRGGVSVNHGPLTYSLQIGEEWRRYGNNERWPCYEVFATTPWNYGLDLDPQQIAGSVTVERKPGALAAQPFTLGDAPVRLRAKARRISGWKMEANGMVGEIVQGPVRSEEPAETVTLVPMGCARLRISMFPLVSQAPGAHEWPTAGAVEATASHSNPGDTISALSDGQTPTSSADQRIPRFTWWDHRGTEEWVEYSTPGPRKLGGCSVYWFDDGALGGDCRTPASWRIEYRDGGVWKPVSLLGECGVLADRANEVRFAPVTTTGIRVVVQLRAGYSGGILEWRAQ